MTTGSNKSFALEYPRNFVVVCEKGSFAVKRAHWSLFTRRGKRAIGKCPFSRLCEKGCVKWDTTRFRGQKQSSAILHTVLTHGDPR